MFTTVVVAAALAFALELVLDPPAGQRAVTLRGVGFVFGAGVAYLIGWFLGARVWPRRGEQLALRLLQTRLKVRRAERLRVYLTGRRDFRQSTPRRILEVIAIAGGGPIIVLAVLALVGVGEATQAAVAGPLALIGLYASFLLSPYWVFSRMGVREVDTVQWTIRRMSRSYADRLRLSNGALLVLALTLTITLAYRAGADREEALLGGLLTVARLTASVLVVAAAGVTHHLRAEPAMTERLEAAALAAGVIDARTMLEAEFLPSSTGTGNGTPLDDAAD